MAQEDVLVHVHVHKTAGTSLRAWLYRAYPHGYGVFYPDYIFDEASLETAGLRDLRLRVFSSHSLRSFHPVMCGRRMRYFTLLRNPVTHVLSFARYMHQVKDEHYGIDQFRNRTGTFTTRDAVATVLDRPLGAQFTDNMQTNFFALRAWCERVAPARTCDPAAYREWSEDDREAYRRERLDVAKEVLGSFLAVGTVERMRASLDLLRARAAPLGFELRPAGEISVENVTEVGLDDLSWIRENDPVGRRFMASIGEDMQLWAHFGQALGSPAIAT